MLMTQVLNPRPRFAKLATHRFMQRIQLKRFTLRITRREQSGYAVENLIRFQWKI